MSKKVIDVQAPEQKMLGHWRSPHGQQAYEKSYAEAMKRLAPPGKTLDVPTDYGSVRVYEWITEQTRSARPILLVPGYTSGVPMWQSNLPDLANKRPVYALDALGDSGMSAQTGIIKNGADQAAWLNQVITHLKVAKIHFVGHSFGGWSAANYASRYPEKVASLSLLEPVFVFQGLNLRIILKTIPAAIPFLPKKWRENLLKDIGGVTEIDLNDPVTRMISEGAEYFERKLPAPERITPEQLRGWEMPVYVAMAANSSLHNSARAVEVAQANIEHVQAKNWTNATHSLPMEFPKEIDAEILTFLDACDNSN
jgi:pimeloyl-ACP methyl ester carboxylesterase